MSDPLSKEVLSAFCDEIEKVALIGTIASAAAKRPLLTTGIGAGAFFGGKGALKGFRQSSTYGALPGNKNTVHLTI